MRPIAVVTALLLAASASAAIPSSERDALVALYQSTNGPGWTQSTNWLGAAGTECTWHGVQCNEDQSSVLDLELYANNLDGTVPPAIRNLGNLRSLQLWSNQLRGAMPPEIGQIATLQLIYLQENFFTGTIPAQWGALKNLAYLGVDGNQLTGPIPTQIGDMIALEELTFTYNLIQGAIPADLARLTNLRTLQGGVNRLGGTLPAALGSLPKLEYLGFGDNQLTGTIPPQLGSLSTLIDLELSYNELTGAIPASLGELHALEALRLNNNQFTGTIPDAFEDLQSLKYLDVTSNDLGGPLPSVLFRMPSLEELLLGDNDFTGSIPHAIGDLVNLQVLGLYYLDLDGTIPIELTTIAPLRSLELQANELSGPIPPELSRLTNLTWLDLSGNAFSGTLPRQLGTLSKLEVLHVYENMLEGTIPAELGQLTNLQILSLASNRFTGTIPDSLRNLTKLYQLYLNGNGLTGPLPSWIGELTQLEDLFVSYNRLSGPLPPGLSTLSKLAFLDLGENQFSGNLPDFNGLPNLFYITINYNRFTGPLPASIGTLENLYEAYLGNNDLSGPLPPQLGNLANLEYLDLAGNSFEGTIPPQLGQLKKLYALSLSGNRLSGTIPPQLADMSGLIYLDLSFNALKGPIPPAITKLQTLEDGRSDFAYNALYTNDPNVRAFINSKHYDGAFEQTQTVLPANFRLVSATDRSATFAWTPIAYSYDGGGYQIVARTSPDGAPSAIATTSGKEFDTLTLRNLSASTAYFFTVSTVTHPHDSQKNLIITDPSPTLQGGTSQRINAPPEVVITDAPNGLVQVDGVEVAADSFTVTNFGDIATTLSLERGGEFFTATPEQFPLAGGASQVITMHSLPQNGTGTQYGHVVVHGQGVDDDDIAYVVLLSTTRPSGTVIAAPVNTRIELGGAPGSDEVGTAQFRNEGTATLTGIVVSDQPWVEVAAEPITIQPGGIGTVNFRIVRAKRPAGQDGALIASLTLVYVTGGNFAHGGVIAHDTSGVSISKVTIVDVTKPPVSTGSIPPLTPGQIPFFIPGITGTSTTQSHLSIVNAAGGGAINDLKLYFKQGAQTSIASLQPLGFAQSVNLVNLVSSVYGGTSVTGSLQIRSGKWSDLSSSAKVSVVADDATYTGSVPIFRGDRSIGTGSRLYLAGVAAPGDLFIQETGGGNATVHTEFHDASGATVGARDDLVAPFALLELTNAIPASAATAIVTNAAGGTTLTAYARLRNASGDTWSIVDWSRFYGYTLGQPVRIPFADGGQPGTRRRAVRTTAVTPSSKTDVVFYNPGSDEENATVQVIETSGSVRERAVVVPAGATVTLHDAASLATSPIAHLVVTPSRGSLIVTARSHHATGGSAIPVLAATAGLRLGQSQIFSALEDSTATRTSYGITETSGASVKVRAEIVIGEGSSLVSTVTSQTFTLGPRQQVYLDELVRSFAGSARDALGDLHNLTLEFEVVEGSGSVVPFVIPTDVASGDTTMIVK